MGCESASYELLIHAPEGTDKDYIIFQLHKRYPESRDYLDVDGKNAASYDWRDVEETMRKFSAGMPGILFELHEEVEYDGTSETRYYFKDGKSVTIEPTVVVTWPAFHESMLK